MSEFVVITPGAEVDLCEEMNHTSTVAVVYRIGRRLHAKELDQHQHTWRGCAGSRLRCGVKQMFVTRTAAHIATVRNARGVRRVVAQSLKRQVRAGA